LTIVRVQSYWCLLVHISPENQTLQVFENRRECVMIGVLSSVIQTFTAVTQQTAKALSTFSQNRVYVFLLFLRVLFFVSR